MVVMANTVSVIVLALLAPTQPLSLLVLHPVLSGSHVLSMHAITKQMLSRGHSVTIVKFHERKLPPITSHSNLTLIDLSVDNSEGNLDFVEKTKNGEFRYPMQDVWLMGDSIQIYPKFAMAFLEMVLAACNAQMSPLLYEQLSQQVYDVALVDLITNECGLALASRLGVPVVGWAIDPTVGALDFSTITSLPSHTPVISTALPAQMSFLQRTYNLSLKAAGLLWHYYWTSRIDHHLSHIFGPTPSVRELVGNISGVLLNSHAALCNARSLPPSYINIGGFQINEDPGQLPSSIEQFIEESGRDGVILFSLGFIFDPASVPTKVVTTLLSAFSRLPQRVIFKSNSSEVVAPIPSNVMMVPWVPQQAILAHPATKLFITHCGINGVLEAIYHGVPMVGMPIFMDQPDNLARIVEHGIGLGLNKFASEEEVVSVVEEVRDNPIYRTRVKELGKLIKLKRNSPMEDAIWMLEYVSKTRGAEHLKLPSRHLNMLQYYSLDSLLALGLLIALPIWCLKHCLKQSEGRKISRANILKPLNAVY